MPKIAMFHRCLSALRFVLVFSVTLVAVASGSAQDLSPPRLIESHRIWDQAQHSAFTDLLRYNDRWYCVFREGSKHVSADGSIRVITSENGTDWKSLALITRPDEDLRDAKISVMPDGRLMINGAGRQADEKIRYHSMAWYSDDEGKSWSKGKRIGDPGFWLWRIQWHDDVAWSMGYQTKRDKSDRSMRFYKSMDGETFGPWVNRVKAPNGAGEDQILFLKDGSAICLLRCETGTKNGLLGKAKAPFKEWTWSEIGMRVGAPKMIQLPDGRILAVTRLYEPHQRTSLSWIDPVASTITECLELPSGGDTSYAGMVLHDGIVWISYYSSHEEKTCIYLAKVKP